MADTVSMHSNPGGLLKHQPAFLHRRRRKLQEMFLSSFCNRVGQSRDKLTLVRGHEQTATPAVTVNMAGLFVALDHRGRVVHREELTARFEQRGCHVTLSIEQRAPHQGSCHNQFLWSDSGKWVKIQSKPSSTGQTRSNGHQTRGPSSQVRPSVIRWSRKGREGYTAGHVGDAPPTKVEVVSEKEARESGDSDDPSDSEPEAIDLPKKRHKPMKRRQVNYLMGRATPGRHSKTWRRDMKALASDSATDLRAWEHSYIDDAVDDWGDVSVAETPRVCATLGEVCYFNTARKLKTYPCRFSANEPRILHNFREVACVSKTVDRSVADSTHSRQTDVNMGSFESSVTNLVTAGKSVTNLVTAGKSVTNLVTAGKSVTNLVTAGKSDTDMVSIQSSVTDIRLTKEDTETSVNGGLMVERLTPVNKIRESDSVAEYLTITVDRSMVRPDTLQAEFKLDYREAACKPRRFVINITRVLCHHVILMSRLRLKAIPRLDFATYLVFTFIREEVVSPDTDEYRVHVNSIWPDTFIKGVRKKYGTQCKIANLHELINDLVSSVGQVSNKASSHKSPTQQTDLLPASRFTLFKSVAAWEAESFAVPRSSEWCQSKDLVNTYSSKATQDVWNEIVSLFSDRKSDHSSKRGPSTSPICGACLSDFLSAGSSAPAFPIALNGCSHWFCEDCWRSRTSLKLKRKKRVNEVVCLERGCNCEVDSVTLLTVFTVNEIRQIHKTRLENYMTVSSLVKLCPNETCGRLVFAKPPPNLANKSVTLVLCQCSKQVCFHCLQSPHWPSTCTMAKGYHDLIKKQKQDVLCRKLLDSEYPDVVLRGRTCPRCGQFVQQSRVENRKALCRCGCVFCWPCGQDTSINSKCHEDCFQFFHQSDERLKQLINTNISSDQSNSSWYKTALHHRKMRHPEVVVAMFAMAENLADKMSKSAQNKSYLGDLESAAKCWSKLAVSWAKDNYNTILATHTQEADPSRPASGLSFSSVSPELSLMEDSRREVSRFTKATESIVLVKVELHYIVEYTAVLLGSIVPLPDSLVQCFHQLEDLCIAFGILLQNPHAQAVRQIIPSFLRLQAQGQRIIGNILSALEHVPPGVFS